MLHAVGSLTRSASIPGGESSTAHAAHRPALGHATVVQDEMYALVSVVGAIRTNVGVVPQSLRAFVS